MIMVRQPINSNQCGQACVTNIAYISLDEAVELVGKKGLTNTKDIRLALSKKGIHLDVRVPYKRMVYGVPYIARVRWPNTKTHWVYIDTEGNVLDPAFGLNPQDNIWPEGTRITSLYGISHD